MILSGWSRGWFCGWSSGHERPPQPDAFANESAVYTIVVHIQNSAPATEFAWYNYTIMTVIAFTVPHTVPRRMTAMGMVR